MKYQLSTLTVLCALSSTEAKGTEEHSKKQLLDRDIGVSTNGIENDAFVPTKILRGRQADEEARVGKALKNVKNPATLNRDARELSQDGLEHRSDELAGDLGILDESYKPESLEIVGHRQLQGTGTWNPDIPCSDYCSQFGDRPLIPGTAEMKDVVKAYLDGDTTYAGPINCWDTSQVTNMEEAFRGPFTYYASPLSTFNSPIGCWDTSSVTKMEDMFRNNRGFNQPLSTWDTSSVSKMGFMFNGATAFNQPVDSFDTSSFNDSEITYCCTAVQGMFYGASSFNQPVGKLVTSNVNRLSDMFHRASAFNQPLDQFNTSKVTAMDEMFEGATAFNQPLDSWNFSSVKFFGGMFSGASSFNQPIDSWNLRTVGDEFDAREMFQDAIAFNSPVGSFVTSNFRDIRNMFRGASSFNQPVADFDISGLSRTSGMFSGASSFNQPVDSFELSNVIWMNNMFENAVAFNQPVDNWNVSAVTYMQDMFSGASSFNQPMNSWDISSAGNMRKMFNGASSFNQCLSTWNEKAAPSASTVGMFSQTNCPIEDDPNKWFSPYWCQGPDICATTSERLFEWNPSVNCDDYCSQFGVERPVKQIEDGSTFRDLVFDSIGRSGRPGYTFGPNDGGYWKNQVVPFNCWDTSLITDMTNAFQPKYYNYLRDSRLHFNEPLGCWDTSAVTSMNGMFGSDPWRGGKYASVFNQPIDTWDVSSVTDMRTMFAGNPDFNQCLSTWAEKTPDSVLTSNMFGTVPRGTQTKCPSGIETPDPTVGPWCQSEGTDCICDPEDDDCICQPTLTGDTCSAPNSPTTGPTTETRKRCKDIASNRFDLPKIGKRGLNQQCRWFRTKYKNKRMKKRLCQRKVLIKKGPRKDRMVKLNRVCQRACMDVNEGNRNLNCV